MIRIKYLQVIGLLIFALMMSQPPAFGERRKLETLKKHLDYNSQQRKTAIDTIETRLIKQLLNKPVNDGLVEKYFNQMSDEGSWADIQYNDQSVKTWGPHNHTSRLLTMAFAYRNKASKYYQNKELRAAILSGLEYFYKLKPVSTNWWFNVIGVPQNFASILILLKDTTETSALLKYSLLVTDDTGNQAHRGANRTWVSEILIYKGCIENDFTLINKGFLSIASTFVVEPEQGIEGIKIDNSFHQHRAQLYNGGYGMAFVDGMAQFMQLAANTPFADAFSSEKRQLFAGLLLNGHQLFGYRNAIDFGTIGRGISGQNSIKNIKSETLDLMMQLDTVHQEDYKNWKQHLQGADFPPKYQGNKYLWKSDIMTQHGSNFYLSAKVISNRTTGTEMLNQQNLKGYNLPLGATNILTSGNEYRNIAPVWDWTRIPGTTSVRNPSSSILSWYLFGSNTFAGGVSNSKNGLIAYEHSYNGIQARKAYFFIGDVLFCMGSGINAFPTQPVVTSVNQCLLNGAVYVGFDNQSQLFSDSSHIFTNLQWVYHDKVGYYFPQGGEISLQQLTQSGTWKSVDGEADDSLVSKKVFSLWINHGNTPKDESYCYAVVPGRTLEQFKLEVQNSGFIIERNDKEIQAISNKQKRCYAVIFYKPGVIRMTDGFQIRTDQPALVLIEKQTDKYSISVADPTYSQARLTLSLNRKIAGSGVSYSGNTSVLEIAFPLGHMTGSTVTNLYLIEN